MVLLGSGAYRLRWCKTLPPVAIPLAERMTFGMGLAVSAFDSLKPAFAG
jgi:hypothetical protein